MAKSASRISDPLGEIYGERAIQAPCFAITSQRNQGNTKRTLFGGIILSEMCTTQQWERWRGTMIFIPERIDVVRVADYSRIDQMITNFLSLPDDDTNKTSYWRKLWSKIET